MRALGVRSYGDASRLEVFDLPPPEPEAGEVLVRVRYAGVNHLDIAMRRGDFSSSSSFETKLPLVLGVEGAGEIVRVGASVRHARSGERVAFCLVTSAAAEIVRVPERALLRVPERFSLELAAALPVCGLAAHYMTNDTFPIGKGDTCLITGAAGGTGHMLAQIAKARGAYVIGIVGSRAKRALAKDHRADHCLVLGEDATAGRVRELTRGHGVHVAFDAVGRDMAQMCLECLRPGGVYVAFGNTSGDPMPIPLALLGRAGSLYATRPHLLHHIADQAVLQRRWEQLCAAVEARELTARVGRVFPLEAAEQAHATLEQRQAQGKILLSIA